MNRRTLGCIVASLFFCLCLGTFGACGSGGGGVNPDSGAGSGGAAGNNTKGDASGDAVGGAGGNGGSDASGDAHGPGDDGPTDRGPQGNACVAAGGTCISAAASCNTPGDPGLDMACGNPNVMHCCMPLPDSGARDLPRPVIGPDGKFACGITSCDPTTSYCMGAVGGIGGDQYSCRALPSQCGSRATCACVRFGPCPDCTEQDGAVTLICPVA